MMSAIFWSFVTSYFTLGVLGILLLVALVVGFTPLVGYLPIVGSYVKLARFVAFCAVAVLAFVVGTRLADERAEVASLRVRLEATQLASARDQKLAAADSEKLRNLEDKIRELEPKISAGVCLDGDDADRLRDLWER